MHARSRRQVRAVDVLDVVAEFRGGPGGTAYVRNPLPLGPYPATLTDRLRHWADTAPERTFLAQRDPQGPWRLLTYGEALAGVRSIAQYLVEQKLQGPVAILSENSIEHALLALGCMYAGVTYAPLSPSYSLASSELTTLRFLLARLEPALVFAGDGARFEKPLALAVQHGARIVTATPVPDRTGTAFAELLATQPGAEAEEACSADPDTVAKILFTPLSA